jgi:hypothetical protein
MAGLVPAIHAGVRIAGTRYSAVGRREVGWISESIVIRHGVDARNKSGHDGGDVLRRRGADKRGAT